MKTNYPICLVISTLGDEGIKYAYNSKIFNKRDLEVMDLITTVMHVLHLSFKGRKLPPISVIPDKCKRGIDGVRHFFVANDTKTVAEWCLCNRDITQPLFEKYGFDVTATVHGRSQNWDQEPAEMRNGDSYYQIFSTSVKRYPIE